MVVGFFCSKQRVPLTEKTYLLTIKLKRASLLTRFPSHGIHKVSIADFMPENLNFQLEEEGWRHMYTVVDDAELGSGTISQSPCIYSTAAFRII